MAGSSTVVPVGSTPYTAPSCGPDSPSVGDVVTADDYRFNCEQGVRFAGGFHEDTMAARTTEFVCHVSSLNRQVFGLASGGS